MAYAKRLELLIKRCRKDHDLERNPSVREIVDWLLERKSTLAPASWRLYRAVLGWTNEHVQADPRFDAGHKAIWRKQTERIRAGGTEGCARDTARTSACKEMSFPLAERQKLHHALTRSEGRFNAALAVMVEAGALTGLRPSEWEGTRIVSAHPFTLEVPNAKIGNNRANGPYRTLIFLEIADDDRSAVTAWLAYIAASTIPYAALQKKLADVMHRMARRIWPNQKRHYSLYSTRHEFAALAKVHFIAAEDASGSLLIAALMGHASDVTASTHYARFKGKTLPPDLTRAVARLPLPSPMEVATVRSRLAEKKSFLEARKACRDAEGTSIASIS